MGKREREIRSEWAEAHVTRLDSAYKIESSK